MSFMREKFVQVIAELSKFEYGARRLFVFKADEFYTAVFHKAIVNNTLTLNLSPKTTRSLVIRDDSFDIKCAFNGELVVLTIPYKAILCYIHPETNVAINWSMFEHSTPGGTNPEIRRALEPVFKYTSTTMDEPHFVYPSADDNMYIDTSKLPERKLTVINGGLAGTFKPPRSPQPKAPPKSNAQIASKIHAQRFKKAEPIENEFFPGLDVGKCQFHVRKVKRPDWMVVHDGGVK